MDKSGIIQASRNIHAAESRVVLFHGTKYAHRILILSNLDKHVTFYIRRKELEAIYSHDPTLFVKEFVWILTKLIYISGKLPDLPTGLLALGL